MNESANDLESPDCLHIPSSGHMSAPADLLKTWVLRGRRSSIAAVALWSVAEAPLRFDAQAGLVSALALVTSKAIWLVATVGALKGEKLALNALGVLCGASVVGVFPSLWFHWFVTPLEFFVAFVGLIFKSMFLFFSLSRSLIKNKKWA